VYPIAALPAAELGAMLCFVIVVSDYQSFRIEVEAVPVDGRYHADVRMRRLFSQDEPRVERVTCFKMSPDLAEHAGELWAKRWIDVQEGA
jgi:hypothetical protein